MSDQAIELSTALRDLGEMGSMAGGTEIVSKAKPPGTDYHPEEAAQLESIFAEEDADWSAVLTPLRHRPAVAAKPKS